jgi:hypothetical protein
MTNSTITLLEPLNLNGLKLNNRIVLAPMTRSRAGKERIPNDLMAEYYVQRVSAGLLITEAATILGFNGPGKIALCQAFFYSFAFRFNCELFFVAQLLNLVGLFCFFVVNIATYLFCDLF